MNAVDLRPGGSKASTPYTLASLTRSAHTLSPITAPGHRLVSWFFTGRNGFGGPPSDHVAAFGTVLGGSATLALGSSPEMLNGIGVRTSLAQGMQQFRPLLFAWSVWSEGRKLLCTCGIKLRCVFRAEVHQTLGRIDFIHSKTKMKRSRQL